MYDPTGRRIFRRPCSLLCLSAVFCLFFLGLLTAGCAAQPAAPDPGIQSPAVPVSQPAPGPVPAAPAPETVIPEPGPQAAPVTPEPAEPAPPEVPAPPEPEPVYYDFSAPVPLSEEVVDNSYFSDAVFIGNSRTDGLKLYSGMYEARFLTGVGLMAYTAFTDRIIPQNGVNVTVMQALSGLEFNKVYVMLGVNELAWQEAEEFRTDYIKLVERIREINPDAILYLQSLIPVTAYRDQQGDKFNNTRIAEYDAVIRAVAEEHQAYYVNVAEAVVDDTGCLASEGAYDGIHLTPNYCVRWLDYLKSHTVDPADYDTPPVIEPDTPAVSEPPADNPTQEVPALP